MDHLPQLQERSGFRIETFFLENPLFAYDEAGFSDFRERRNFTFTQPHGLQTNWESSSFFQSWLFFGTLVEVFKVYDIPIQQDDFLSYNENCHAIITTKCLQDYIAAWIVAASREYPGCLESSKHRATARMIGERLGSSAGDSVASLISVVRSDENNANIPQHSRVQRWTEGVQDARARAESIWKVLNTVYTQLCSNNIPSQGIDAAVWDSVLILCTTLQTAAFFIYRALPLEAPVTFTIPFNTVPARLSPQLFRENGWCPREMKIISDLVEGDHCVRLLCAQFDRRHNLGHSNCNAGRCDAYQVRLGTYRTRHQSVGCSCDFLGFEGFNSEDPSKSKLYKTIMNNQSRLLSSRPTPMAVYHKRRLRLVPVSTRQLFGQTFVAISHVWADGLGNSVENSLPRCQLERIQNLVDKQFPNMKGPVPFWMDTLCIPVAEGEFFLYKGAKKRAIREMEGIYKSATKILVLDRTLTSLSSRHMSKEEIGLRIMCSGWARRLWTLQEGLFQARVYYQFLETTHTFNDLANAVRQTHAFPTRAMTIPNSHFLHGFLTDSPNCAAPYEPLACFAQKALSPCWTRISSFFKELDIRYSQPDPDWFPGMQLVSGLSVLVPRAMRTIAYRTTSRMEDEGLILASLTNWRAGSSASLVEVPPGERLRACFEQFAVVPSQLIFLDQKRYEEPGKRWIPKSLLAQSSEGTDPLPYEHRIISDEFSWPSVRGITAEYPSFRLVLPPDWSPSTGIQRVSLFLAGNYYQGFVHEAGSQNPPKALPSNDLVLITPRTIGHGPHMCVAVLVSIPTADLPRPYRRSSGAISGLMAWGYDAVANHHDKSRMIGRHEALVDLERNAEADETLPSLDAVPISELLTNVAWRIG